MAQSISSNRKTAQQSLRAAAEDLAGEIATLNTLEPAALLQKWKALFGTDPSPLLARIFMVRAIAYRLQERRFGGLKPSTQRLLDRVCEGRADVGRKRMPAKRVSAGTVLIASGAASVTGSRCSTTASSTAAGATDRCPKWPA
jgi:hypothetical protein